MKFTLERFRAVLREEREARIGGRDKLAEKTGVNRTTIQNAEVGPDIPQIDTVARLVEGMPDLTLSAFFARIEALPTSHDVSKVTPSTKTGSDAHADSVSSAAAIDFALIQSILVKGFEHLGERIDRAVDRLADRHQQVPRARTKKSEQRTPARRRTRKVA